MINEIEIRDHNFILIFSLFFLSKHRKPRLNANYSDTSIYLVINIRDQGSVSRPDFRSLFWTSYHVRVSILTVFHLTCANRVSSCPSIYNIVVGINLERVENNFFLILIFFFLFFFTPLFPSLIRYIQIYVRTKFLSDFNSFFINVCKWYVKYIYSNNILKKKKKEILITFVIFKLENSSKLNLFIDCRFSKLKVFK